MVRYLKVELLHIRRYLAMLKFVRLTPPVHRLRHRSHQDVNICHEFLTESHAINILPGIVREPGDIIMQAVEPLAYPYYPPRLALHPVTLQEAELLLNLGAYPVEGLNLHRLNFLRSLPGNHTYKLNALVDVVFPLFGDIIQLLKLLDG